MNQRFVGIVVLVFTAVAPCIAQAPSESAFAGYLGLLLTPTGAFSPVNNALGLPETKASSSLQVRYGRWQPTEGSVATSNFGVGITMHPKSLATTFEIGYSHTPNCSLCNGIMGGIDMQMPLEGTPVGTGRVEIGLNPAIGIEHPTSDERREMGVSAALGLPVALSIPVSQHGVLVPFISPGLGVGRLSSGNQTESGTRAMLGGGATLANSEWVMRVTVSFRKIFIDGSPTVFGLGLSIDP